MSPVGRFSTDLVGRRVSEPPARSHFCICPLLEKAIMSNISTEESSTFRGKAECPLVNVGVEERKLSLISGGALTLLGLVHGHWSGFLLMGAGAGLIYRGISGHCQLYQALHIDTAQGEQRSKDEGDVQPS